MNLSGIVELLKHKYPDKNWPSEDWKLDQLLRTTVRKKSRGSRRKVAILVFKLPPTRAVRSVVFNLSQFQEVESILNMRII